MACSVHNHDVDHKLACHPIVSHSSIEKKKIVTEMTTNMVLLKNILKTLEKKRFGNVANIKNVYNVQHKQQGYKWSNN